MPTKTLNFNTLTAAAPYVIGSAPDNLTDYTRTAGSVNFNISNLSGTKYLSGASSSSNSVIRDDTVLAGAVRSAFVTTGLTNGSAVGPALLDAGNDGYVALTSDGTGNTRLFRVVDSQLGSQIGSSITKIHADNQVREIRWEIGGIISLWDGATQIGSNFSDTTYTPTYAAALTRGGNLRSMASYYEAAQTITSINSGSPITVGQTGVPFLHTGFTGALDSVTTNRSGVTCAITAGDANSTTVTVSGWVEGGDYPVVDNTVTFTCTRGAESASATQTLTKPANYAQVTFSGAITDDPNLIGYHLAANGHTVNGGTFYYRTNQVVTLTVNADTSWTCDPAGGTFSATFIPSAGATSGNAYLFDITLLNGSIVSVQGLTSVGLTSTGLTQIGLTSVGLC
jgi:hypothetical protein